MKIEYSETGFPQKDTEMATMKELLKRNAPLAFGIMAFVIALSLLPIGLFINIGLDIFGGVLAENLAHYTAVFLAVATLIAIMSVALAIFSILLFKKSEKRLQDTLGVFFSIVSFAACAVAITLIVLGLMVW